ncbi:MAG: type IX secretion system membrane protein PorP/SprF [Salibacteraceae bacterium]
MRKGGLILLIFCLLGTVISAQQPEQYTQYLFNHYAINPAVAGSKPCTDIKLGYRRQWVGLDGAPEVSFFTFHKAIGKKNGIRQHWHGIGVYMFNEEIGAFGRQAVYPSYAFHVRLNRNLIMSTGAFLGFRRESFSGAGLVYPDLDDPTLGQGVAFFLYPEIHPGIWLYNKSFYTGISVRQVFKNQLKQGGQQIGSPAGLPPHFYFTIGRQIESQRYYYTYIPSVHVRYTALWPPSIDANMLVFYKDVIGLGASYRLGDAVSAMMQLKLAKFVSVGYSYDYTTSKMRRISSNTHEIILSLTPCAKGRYPVKNQLCPAYN